MCSTLSAEENKRRDEICYYRAFITLPTRTRNGTFDDDSFVSSVLDIKKSTEYHRWTNEHTLKDIFMFLFSNAHSHIVLEDVALKEIE